MRVRRRSLKRKRSGLEIFLFLGLSEFEVYRWPVATKTFSTDCQWTSICGGQHHTLALDNKGSLNARRMEKARVKMGGDNYVFTFLQEELSFSVGKNMVDWV